MAAAIGVSPSYLNLIERDQRPLTVQVLLKLSAVYGIDVAELSAGDNEGTVAALKEVFADPLLTGEVASPSELSEFAEAAPNAARGMTRLFEAYREVAGAALRSLAFAGEKRRASGRKRRAPAGGEGRRLFRRSGAVLPLDRGSGGGACRGARAARRSA